MCVRPGKMRHRVGFGLAIVPQGPPIRTDGLPKAPKENPGARPGTLLASLTNQRAAAMVMSGDPRTPTVRAGGLETVGDWLYSSTFGRWPSSRHEYAGGATPGVSA